MSDIIIFLALVAMGYFIGSFSERRHFRSLETREADKLLQPIVTMEDVAYPEDQIQSATLVSGSAVISVDYFKRLLAGLRKILRKPSGQGPSGSAAKDEGSGSRRRCHR